MMIHRLGTWWMDLFGLGWLNNADIWNNIGELRSACSKFAPQNQFKPDVAVIYDERSPSYERDQRAEPLLVSLLAEPVPFYRCGSSVGFYLLSDLKRPNFPPANGHSVIRVPSS